MPKMNVFTYITKNNEKDLCCYCEQFKSGRQTLIGALCENCEHIFYDWMEKKFGTWDCDHEKVFIQFIAEKLRGVFVFR